ncbi:MAG TPA: hypothetical protein VIP70_12700 [Nitrososphaeraceae archaeon]
MSEETKRESDATPTMNPEERPDLQDYKSKETKSPQTHICQDCNKEFTTIEELTAHYKKDHPESF